MVTFGMSGDGRGFDPLVLLLLALMFEAYVGEMRSLFKAIRHPVRVIGDIVGFFDVRLNREHRSEMDRAIRGALVVLIMVVAAGVVGWSVAWLSFRHPLGWILEFLGLIALLAARGLYDHVRAVAVALKESLDAGRSAVAQIVGRDPESLDAAGVARAAIESLAENFNDGVVAPVFWYVLFGFPGLFVYKTVNTLDSMIGHMTPRHRAFGMTAARLDDVLNLIPARLAGLFIVLGAVFVGSASPGRALKAMWRDAGRHRSVNAGWPEAAMAGALGLKLVGPRHYRTQTVNDPFIGDGTPDATPTDVNRALYLYVVACLINAMWVAAIAMVRFSDG